MELFISIILGLTIGSFLNVVIFRSANGGSIIKGRSKCPKCGKILKWYELIPLFSFVIQCRKCRECKKKISWQYPLVEIFTAGVFICLWQFFIKFQKQNFGSNLLYIVFIIVLLALVSAFITTLVYDLIYLEIPTSFLVWGICLSFLLAIIKDVNSLFLGKHIFLGDFQNIISSSFLASGIAGALIAGGLFFALVFFSKEKWMGQGDIYIGAAIGMLLGWPWILESLLLAVISGAIVGIILMLIGGKKLSSKIAFSPFLILAGLTTMMWGEKLFYWYIRFIS